MCQAGYDGNYDPTNFQWYKPPWEKRTKEETDRLRDHIKKVTERKEHESGENYDLPFTD